MAKQPRKTGVEVSHDVRHKIRIMASVDDMTTPAFVGSLVNAEWERRGYKLGNGSKMPPDAKTHGKAATDA